MPLTPAEVARFHQDGIVIMHNYLSPEHIVQLQKEYDTLLANYNSNHPRLHFDNDSTSNEYFLSSSNKIHYFTDPKAPADTPAAQAMHKIGHGLHLHNLEFDRITVNDDVASICRQLGFTHARACQSMIIIKQPHFGAQVDAHNDATFLYTDPSSCVGFWFALNDCDSTNGCLEYIPGSHQTPLDRRFVNVQGKTKFVDIDTKPTLDAMSKAKDVTLATKYSDDEFQKVVIPQGSLVLIHGNLIHRSAQNTSDKPRLAYTFHVVDGNAKYDLFNWLQIPPLSERSDPLVRDQSITNKPTVISSPISEEAVIIDDTSSGVDGGKLLKIPTRERDIRGSRGSRGSKGSLNGVVRGEGGAFLEPRGSEGFSNLMKTHH